jgi:hypothetical protein
MSDAATYTEALQNAFRALLDAEQRLTEAEGTLKAVTGPLNMEVLQAGNVVEARWIEIRNIMGEAGVVEETLPGAAIDGNAHSDFRIAYGTPPRKVIIADPDAVPDEFVKTERKPKLKEIADTLRMREQAKLPALNWAAFERADPKLQWRLIKRGK